MLFTQFRRFSFRLSISQFNECFQSLANDKQYSLRKLEDPERWMVISPESKEHVCGIDGFDPDVVLMNEALDVKSANQFLNILQESSLIDGRYSWNNSVGT
jgi:hypothetical protein